MRSLTTITRKLITLTLIGVFLASCGGTGTTGTGGGGAQAWIDQPVTGSLLPLAVFTLKAHASTGTSSGVTRIEFLVNDVTVGSVDTDSSLPIVYAQTDWNPSAAGSYSLSARAYSGNGSTTSAIAMVCVSDKVTTASISYSGDCANPIAGAGVTSLPVTVNASVVNDSIFYGACDPSTLRVNATLTGDLSSVDSVRVLQSLDDRLDQSAMRALQRWHGRSRRRDRIHTGLLDTRLRQFFVSVAGKERC